MEPFAFAAGSRVCLSVPGDRRYEFSPADAERLAVQIERRAHLAAATDPPKPRPAPASGTAGFLAELDHRAQDRARTVEVAVPGGTRVEVRVSRTAALVSDLLDAADEAAASARRLARVTPIRLPAGFGGPVGTDYPATFGYSG